MFFVDEPYISDFFKRIVKENQIPVVETENARKMALLPGTIFVSEAEAIHLAHSTNPPLLYSTSENAIGWIVKNLSFTSIPAKIDLFKNKARFRHLLRPLYPDFFYQEIRTNELPALDLERVPLPFIIKPTVGFFSMGVRKVTRKDEWPLVVDSIYNEIEQVKGLYPDEVLDIDSFIIEEVIEGDEFAIDAYFNADGEAVILDILHHTFASEADVSDRVYSTSKEIIDANLAEFTRFVAEIGHLSGAQNFPVHIELRRRKDGVLLPIEVNPMRFGGWCSTPDLAYHAYGINPYLYFVQQRKPDWTQVLAGKDGLIFSVIVLENSTGFKAEEIAVFDSVALLKKFGKPLEFRPIDYAKFPVFGFLFAETRQENFAELGYILKSDLREFLKIVAR
jgi:carbamoylphosphate synthase large subunit